MTGRGTGAVVVALALAIVADGGLGGTGSASRAMAGAEELERGSLKASQRGASEPAAAAAEGKAEARPELVKLAELSSDNIEIGPWVSADGRTIYWTVFRPRLGPVIWKAERSDPSARFGKPERLFAGAYPSLTRDGLVMVFNRRGTLRITSRKSVDEPFPAAADIAELQNEPYCRRPCISDDGLTLYFERLEGRPRGRVEVCVTHRKSASAPWEAPKPLKFETAQGETYRISCPFAVQEGSALLCADYRRRNQGSSNFMVWTRSRPDGPFDTSRYLEFEGLRAFGLCPRYVAATNELYFSSDRTVSGRHDDGGADLYVIKNFHLPAASK